MFGKKEEKEITCNRCGYLVDIDSTNKREFCGDLVFLCIPCSLGVEWREKEIIEERLRNAFDKKYLPKDFWGKKKVKN